MLSLYQLLTIEHRGMIDVCVPCWGNRCSAATFAKMSALGTTKPRRRPRDFQPKPDRLARFNRQVRTGHRTARAATWQSAQCAGGAGLAECAGTRKMEQHNALSTIKRLAARTQTPSSEQPRSGSSTLRMPLLSAWRLRSIHCLEKRTKTSVTRAAMRSTVALAPEHVPKRSVKIREFDMQLTQMP